MDSGIPRESDGSVKLTVVLLPLFYKINMDTCVQDGKIGGSVYVADRMLGPEQPCFIIAEAGVNHNGDITLAHSLIDAAADAGVDAVKFQTFDPEKLAAAEAPKATYQVKNTGEEGSQLEMLRSLVLPPAVYPELIQHSAQRGLMFLSTPFDEDSADFLEKMGLPAFKISSGDLTNHPLLAHLARKGRPLLLSTGMASMDQVNAAVAAVRAAGGPPLVLFHCVTSYPANASDCNLRAIGTLRSQFGVPVGWSDHTTGFDVSMAAVALGANALEKHFTLDRKLPGPDHIASLEPSELSAMVKAIRRIESAMGDGKKQPRECEIAIAAVARKSLHWKIDLQNGAKVKSEDVAALRPGTGISPENLTWYLGREVIRDVRKGQMLTEQDFLQT
jgi:N,N'-diacetyllegionaminate synthase